MRAPVQAIMSHAPPGTHSLLLGANAGNHPAVVAESRSWINVKKKAAKPKKLLLRHSSRVLIRVECSVLQQANRRTPISE